MSYNPQNPNGQATSANSAPVVIASDQSALPVSLSGGATAANQTNGTQQSKITDGTNVANVVAGDSGFNGVVTNSGTKTITFTTSSSGVQTLLANTSLEGYSWIELVYTSVGTGLALQGQFATVSGGTYVNGTFFSGNGAATTLGAAVSVYYASPVRGNFFQIAVTALTSGTFTGTVILRAIPPPITGVGADQAGTWSVGGSTNATTGSITTSSTAVTTGSLSGFAGYVEISVHGTYAGVSFGITESDDAGTTFYGVPIYDVIASAWFSPGTTITPGTNASKTYYVPMFPSTTEVKVLASAWASGSATIRIQQSATGAVPGSTMAQLMDAAGNARGANIDANHALLVDPGSATAATAPALAMEQGAVAATSLPTAVTNGQLAGIMADKFGRQVVINSGTRDIVGQQSTTITSSTSATTVITAVASTFTDISSVVFANSSATATLATLSDGTNSYYFYVPAAETRGAVYHVPLSATTVNTAWTVTCGTSVASLYVTTHYIKNQ